jgi:hypothetical protein
MDGQRLINDHSFVCPELAGKKIESMVGYYEGDQPNGIDMVVLKVEGKDLYQRFFLDAGIGFWEEWSEEEATEDYENFQPIDLSSKYFLSGKNIEAIECKGSYKEFSSIIFEIENTKLIYQYTDNNDLESETVLHQL